MKFLAFCCIATYVRIDGRAMLFEDKTFIVGLEPADCDYNKFGAQLPVAL